MLVSIHENKIIIEPVSNETITLIENNNGSLTIYALK